MKTFAEAEQAINDFAASLDSNKSYSLKRIENILGSLDNPQDKFKTVHVAGTSGKTSTSYFVASMLKAAGFKTGLSISPHIEEINERVQIDLEPLPEKVFCAELQKFMDILNTLSIKPTYFELLVAFAYWYFAKKGVEYAVVEVGLGGLLDGTNVIKRPDKVCVITDVGLDHTHILGDTLSKIAAQKAGIIQDHNPVFMHAQPEDVKAAVIERTSKQHGVLHYIQQPPDRELPSVLPGFQKRNWSLAREVCEFILKREAKNPLTDEQWLKTAEVPIPGRLEVFSYKDKTLVMDGAHNSQKMKTLVQSFEAIYPGVRPTVLMAVGDNKNEHVELIAKELETISAEVILTSFDKGQDTPKKSIDPTRLAKYFKVDAITEPDLKKALKLALGNAENTILITGSLYLISEVRKLLKPTS